MELKHQLEIGPLIFAVIISGCASFEPGLRTSDLMRARQPTVVEVQDGLEVSVEEFVSPQKSRQAFDADVASYGVLPLLVRVENKGSATYKVSQQSIRALLDGQSLPMLGGEEAANQAATSEYAGKALGWTIATGPFAILFWPATIAGSAAHTHSVNRRIQQHFASLQFNDALLKPNQVAAGFLYFTLPGNLNSSNNLLVELKPIEEPNGKELTYKLSLPSLNLSGR